jgi:uncharacterized protein
MATRFEWDPVKAAANLRKHGGELRDRHAGVRRPFRASTEQDRIEGGEARWQTLGMVEGRVLLLVAHAFRDEDEDSEAIEVIRIISARAADRGERRRYEQETR